MRGEEEGKERFGVEIKLREMKGEELVLRTKGDTERVMAGG